MIEIEHLTKRYDGTAVVDDVSLVIEPGTIAVIVGTSGSGKTTLLRMINRLVEPTSGAVRLDGRDNRSLPDYELRRGIGYAIQGHGLFPHRTVAENIATVPRLLGWDRARIQTRVRELLTLFQLDPDAFGGRYPHELSGGQQQRVGVARALAAEPNVLLMDEPFGALDSFTREEMNGLVEEIWLDRPTTIVFITHSIEEAIFLSDRVIVLSPRPGRVARTYSVPFPRPRSFEIMATKEVFDLTNAIKLDIVGGRIGKARATAPAAAEGALP